MMMGILAMMTMMIVAMMMMLIVVVVMMMMMMMMKMTTYLTRSIGWYWSPWLLGKSPLALRLALLRVLSGFLLAAG